MLVVIKCTIDLILCISIHSRDGMNLLDTGSPVLVDSLQYSTRGSFFTKFCSSSGIMDRKRVSLARVHPNRERATSLSLRLCPKSGSSVRNRIRIWLEAPALPWKPLFRHLICPCFSRSKSVWMFASSPILDLGPPYTV